MNRLPTAIGFTFIVVTSLLTVPVLRADAPTTQPLSDDQRMQSWWDDLAKPEPAASRALLNFAGQPEQAVAFIKDRLKPLVISEEDVNMAIADLSSEDETVWKPAFEKLEYFDPRLTIDLPTLMNQVTEPAARSRLVELLSEREPDSLQGKTIELRSVGDGEFNFFNGINGSGSSWWAEAKVSKLNMGWTEKPTWTRAVRAIVLLEHNATPDAIAIIKEMATGNADAQPTKVAQEALASQAK